MNPNQALILPLSPSGVDLGQPKEFFMKLQALAFMSFGSPSQNSYEHAEAPEEIREDLFVPYKPTRFAKSYESPLETPIVLRLAKD